MDKLQYYVNDFGDRYLYDVNRGIFNQIGADNIFKRRFGERLFGEDRLYIIIGTDSGMLLRHVDAHGVPSGTRYLFLELDALLPTIRGEIGNLPTDGAIHLAGQNDFLDILKEVKFSDYANIQAISLIESMGATDAFVGEYRAFVADVRQQFDAVMWSHGVQLSNPSFVSRQLENLIEHHCPAAQLRDSFTGRTAIVLGGGPSLDEMLPWIDRHRERLVIIAVSRICRRLKEAGVVPHIVVSIDPTGLSFDISKELLVLDPRVVLVHANHMSFRLLAQWRGRSLFLDRRYPWPCRDEPANIAAAGPTVTNTAVALAVAMGFDTLLLAGIDLCMSREGYSHAKGSNEFDAGPRLGAANMRVTTNGGWQAETTPDFFNAIQAFGAQALAARGRGIRVINPAAGAAVMEGVEHVPVDRVTLPVGNDDTFARLHACIDGDSLPQRRANYAHMLRELARANGRLRRVAELADEALRCNDGLFGRHGKPADFRFKKRMDKIERLLDGRLKDFSAIVRMFSAQAFLHMPPSDREWTDDEIEQAGRTYYTAYRNNARQILKLVENAQQRVATADVEDSDHPDFDRMLAQWSTDQVPGRVRVWRHRHPEAATRLPQDIAQRFDAMEQAFQELLDTRETGHAQKVRAETDLGPVRGKLQVLFKERNNGELDNTLRQLEEIDSGEAAQLAALCRGYLAELADDGSGAFAQYSGIIDMVRDELQRGAEERPNPRLEDALRRMVVIAMSQQQHQQALLILQTLAGMAPAFEPQFAELLRLTGDLDAAVNVYTDYLSKAPGDHVAMLRLGKLYQTIGATDAAKTAFNYVLEKDPDNKAARSLLEQTGTAA